jgi:hypothetical protein
MMLQEVELDKVDLLCVMAKAFDVSFTPNLIYAELVVFYLGKT